MNVINWLSEHSFLFLGGGGATILVGLLLAGSTRRLTLFKTFLFIGLSGIFTAFAVELPQQHLVLDHGLLGRVIVLAAGIVLSYFLVAQFDY